MSAAPTALPAITVLMPAYNAAPYIAEAIESVLAQTFKLFELLIINDGSTDETAAIIAQFTDPRIRVISRENKGLIASLNEGLAAARAPLVARFDADDWCLPNRLEVQFAFLQQHPECVLVASDVVYTDVAGTPVVQLNAGGYTDAEIRARFFRACPFFHPTVLFRKAVILAAGGYPAGALTFEDWLLWKAVLEKGKVAVLPQVLVHMRLNPASVTVDEKWRGPAFSKIRQQALERGAVLPEEARRLEEIVASQNNKTFKEAAYHVLVGKKFLWNNPDSRQARYNFGQALRRYPFKASLYAFWSLSFLPAGVRKQLYRSLKSAHE